MTANAPALLPEEFADLQPFAQAWALASQHDRMQRRLNSSMEEIQAFYDAVFPRAEEIMAYLDRFELDDMEDEALHLMWLLYSLSLVSLAVDIFKQPRTPSSGGTYLHPIAEPVP
jgi:hypothetical protein